MRGAGVQNTAPMPVERPAAAEATAATRAGRPAEDGPHWMLIYVRGARPGETWAVEQTTNWRDWSIVQTVRKRSAWDQGVMVEMTNAAADFRARKL